MSCDESKETSAVKRTWQAEADRVRKGYFVRMLPRAHAALRAAARREGVTLADYLERIGLALPPPE